MLTGTKKREHITPVLASLHWLPVHYRIQYKMALMVFKALNGQAPAYVEDMLCIYVPSRSLRSASQSLLIVPWSRLKQKGDHAFAVAAPRLWNGLPSDIRHASSVTVFKTKLKTQNLKLNFYRLAFSSH